MFTVAVGYARRDRGEAGGVMSEGPSQRQDDRSARPKECICKLPDDWCEACENALMARSAEAGGARLPGWQPIETAPKDGSTVLGYTPNESVAYGDVFYEREQEHWARLPDCFSVRPTHWMPLPDPPADRSRPPEHDNDDCREAQDNTPSNGPFTSLCACGHEKGRHQLTNLGYYTNCSDCGCRGFVNCNGFPS